MSANMPGDDLSAPLGQHKPRKPRFAIPALAPRIAVAVLSILVVAVAGRAMIGDDPFGGEPIAVVAIGPASSKVADGTPGKPGTGKERPSRYDGPPPADAAAPAAPPNGRTVTIIDGTSGKRHDVVIPATPADGKPNGLDPRLSESSPDGPLPKIAPDGSRASEIYARPVKPIAGKPNAPRIAIVVGGLGIGSTVTAEAIARLPGPVTLAFTPYGNGLEQATTRARADGHEVLLQVPMEPFDYPDNDPGPQTLLTTLEPAQNIERLQWLMGRFQGYVGMINAMGARFTTSETALAPVLREAARRGLLYVDDGASQRSVAPQIAALGNIPFARADVMIDAVPTPSDVERALNRLETIARERGLAVGMANALPMSIDRIAKWTKGAEGRGILLVPISAAARPTGDDRRRTTENRASGN
jgi:uncharacterized protein